MNRRTEINRKKCQKRRERKRDRKATVLAKVNSTCCALALDIKDVNPQSSAPTRKS